jgi:tail tube protein gp19
MPPAAKENRSYAGAHFALELDGKDEVSLFRSIEGGGVKVDVMTYNTQVEKTYQRYRQLGKPKYEDIKIQVGMAMSDPFWNWVSSFFVGTQDRKTGAIVAADFYYKERARRNFKAAMIRELTFPKLDASDKGPVYMSIGISVEDIEFVAGSGNKIKLIDPKSPGFTDQMLWSACNFVFTLHGVDGADLAATKVTKIDSFTVKQNIVEYHMGGQLSPIKTPSTIDFPNISFYLPESHAQPFIDHFTAKNKLWQKNDKAGNASPLHGSIICNDAQGGQLCELTFLGADIVSVTPDRMESSTEEIKMVKVELYTESMTFKPGAGTANTGTV